MIIESSLKFYVRDFYIKRSGNRGGEIFKPFYKKDLKPFQTRIRYAINQPSKVLDKISVRHPIELN